MNPHAWDCPCGTRNALQFITCRVCGNPARPGMFVYPPGAEPPERRPPTTVRVPAAAQESWYARLPLHWKLALLLGVILFGAVLRSPPTPGGTPDLAAIKAERFVRESLKSPSTAKFPFGQAQVFKRGEHGWTVKGPVDAQNGFGAMLRSEYVCEMDYDEATQEYRVTGLYLDGEKLRP